MEPQHARTGRTVRVKEGHRKTNLVGLHGTVQHRWGHPDYPALDVLFEDGRSELFWFHELEAMEKGARPSVAERSLRG